MKWLKTEDPTFTELRINLKELGPKLEMMAKFHSEMAKLTEGLPKEYVALTTKGASESLSIMAGVLCAASWQEILGMPEGKAQFDAASAALTSHESLKPAIFEEQQFLRIKTLAAKSNKAVPKRKAKAKAAAKARMCMVFLFGIVIMQISEPPQNF